MKKIGSLILAPVIVGIIITVFSFYINNEKVDIKYSLSSPIKIPSKSNVVRQLKIQNVGNASAEEIIITLNGDIQNYDIIKYAEKDIYEEFDLPTGLGKQIYYKQLPRDGSIIITMNISGSGLLDVDIKHNKGKASEVFSSQMKIGYALLFFIFSILFYLISSAKYFTDDYWISSVLQYDKKKIFTRNKPYLLTESRWKEIKTLAIKNELAEIRNETFISVEGLKDSKATFYLTAQNLKKLELSKLRYLVNTKILQV